MQKLSEGKGDFGVFPHTKNEKYRKKNVSLFSNDCFFGGFQVFCVVFDVGRLEHLLEPGNHG